MKNQTSKRAKRSRTKFLLTAAGLALALTSAAPAAGGLEPAIEGRAEAQLHKERQVVFGPFVMCIGWCLYGYCCVNGTAGPILVPIF